MITKLDFSRLLQGLQSLDIEKADNETLINYIAKLEFVKEEFNLASETLQSDYESMMDSCMEYYSALINELDDRGIEISSIWDEMADNPELLVASMLSMPLISLFDFIENLKKIVEVDEEVQPLLDLAMEIVKSRTSGCGVC